MTNIERSIEEHGIRVYDREVPLRYLIAYHNMRYMVAKDNKRPVPEGVKEITPKVEKAIRSRSCHIVSSTYSLLPADADCDPEVMIPFITEEGNVFENFGLGWSFNQLSALAGFLCGVDGLREAEESPVKDSERIVSFKNEFVKYTPISIISRCFATSDDGAVMSFREGDKKPIQVRVRLDAGELPPLEMTDPSRAQVNSRIAEIEGRLKALSSGKEEMLLEAQRSTLYQVLGSIKELSDIYTYINRIGNETGLVVELIDPRTIPISPANDFDSVIAVKVAGDIHITHAISHNKGLSVLGSLKYFGKKTAEFELPKEASDRIFAHNPIFYFGKKADFVAGAGLARPLGELKLNKSISAGNHPHIMCGSDAYMLGRDRYCPFCQGDWGDKLELSGLEDYIDGLHRNYIEDGNRTATAIEISSMFDAEVKRRSK